jgi:hypothetical protein
MHRVDAGSTRDIVPGFQQRASVPFQYALDRIRHRSTPGRAGLDRVNSTTR